jgi:hypothetical protein
LSPTAVALIFEGDRCQKREEEATNFNDVLCCRIKEERSSVVGVAIVLPRKQQSVVISHKIPSQANHQHHHFQFQVLQNKTKNYSILNIITLRTVLLEINNVPSIKR